MIGISRASLVGYLSIKYTFVCQIFILSTRSIYIQTSLSDSDAYILLQKIYIVFVTSVDIHHFHSVDYLISPQSRISSCIIWNYCLSSLPSDSTGISLNAFAKNCTVMIVYHNSFLLEKHQISLSENLH